MSNSVYNDILKTALGFDRMFRTMNMNTATGFPPHNIEVHGVDPSDPDGYTIELAIAGFRRSDVTIRVVKEDGIKLLEVRGTRPASPRTYLTQNIAYRDFVRRWSIADNVEVSGAKLEDGILSIQLGVIKVETKPDEQVINIG